MRSAARRSLAVASPARRSLSSSLPKEGTPEHEALRLQEAREKVDAVHGSSRTHWWTIFACSAGVAAIVGWDVYIQQPHDREMERRKRALAGKPVDTRPLPPGVKERLADGRILMDDGSIKRSSD